MKNKSNQIKCNCLTSALLATITVILVVATAVEIIVFVNTEQVSASFECSNCEDAVIIGKNIDDNIRRNEYHSTIVTLLCATLLSFSVDVAYISLKNKK